MDYGDGIALNSSGNVYVSGMSIGTWGVPVRSFTGNGADAFAVKLDSNGSLIGNTFLGSEESDYGIGIASRAADVYVSGWSLLSWDSPVRAHQGYYDVFVAKIPDIVSCAPKPEAPLLLKPGDASQVQGPRVKLDWTDTACTESYQLILRQDSKTGPLVLKRGGLPKSKTKIKTGLTAGVTYFWRVQSVNPFGKSKSLWRSFTVR